MLRQISVQLIGREHGPAWFLELFHSRRRNLFRDNDFHRVPQSFQCNHNSLNLGLGSKVMNRFCEMISELLQTIDWQRNDALPGSQYGGWTQSETLAVVDFTVH
jgi:hypothetical protein